MKTFRKKESRLRQLNRIGEALRSERGVSLVVVIMLMVIILAITGAGLLFSSIDLRVSGNYRVGTQAFYAADMGASAGFAQIVMDPVASSAAILRTPATGVPAYCSGTPTTSNNCTNPQPLTVTPITVPGYSLGAGTGYSFYLYQIDATGVGPLGATRQVQALAQYGPVPN
jgi:Tfp pilus assembly protein PilX